MMTGDRSREEAAVSPGAASLSSRGNKAALANGKVLGLPLGNFGLFASVLIAFSSGFLAFFLATFVAIFGILFYNTAGHHFVDYSVAYKQIALPVGIAVLLVSLLFFGAVWIRRKLAGK